MIDDASRKVTAQVSTKRAKFKLASDVRNGIIGTLKALH